MKTALLARAEALRSLADMAIQQATRLARLSDDAGARELIALADRLRAAQFEAEEQAAKLS
jgi:hypothetical protein